MYKDLLKKIAEMIQALHAIGEEHPGELGLRLMGEMTIIRLGSIRESLLRKRDGRPAIPTPPWLQELLACSINGAKEFAAIISEKPAMYDEFLRSNFPGFGYSEEHPWPEDPHSPHRGHEEPLEEWADIIRKMAVRQNKLDREHSRLQDRFNTYIGEQLAKDATTERFEEMAGTIYPGDGEIVFGQWIAAAGNWNKSLLWRSGASH